MGSAASCTRTAFATRKNPLIAWTFVDPYARRSVARLAPFKERAMLCETIKRMWVRCEKRMHLERRKEGFRITVTQISGDGIWSYLPSDNQRELS